MSTHLININDTSGNWWISEPIYPITTCAGTWYNISYISVPTIKQLSIDPKLERQYNVARAKNNKSEMRRLEKLIANN
jgi:hypothetical protein